MSGVWQYAQGLWVCMRWVGGVGRVRRKKGAYSVACMSGELLPGGVDNTELKPQVVRRRYRNGCRAASAAHAGVTAVQAHSTRKLARGIVI